MFRSAMRWSEVSQGKSNDSSNHWCPSDVSAPTIKNHSMTHFNGYMFCFGGYDGTRNHNSLLVYKIDEQRWIRPVLSPTSSEDDAAAFASSNIMNDPSTIVVHGTPPPERNGQYDDDGKDDSGKEAKIFIVGGWLGTGPLAASDVHVLDVRAGGKRLHWYQPPVKGSPPGPCNMHSADYVKAQREIYVFRGGNGREYLNDLHALNIDTMTWRIVETNGEKPQPRANHSSAVLEEPGELCLFGGWNGEERLNDIHILNIATSMWTRPRVGGILPHPRAGMTFTALGRRIVLFGGLGTSAKYFNDLHVLDQQEMVWLDVAQNEDSKLDDQDALIKVITYGLGLLDGLVTQPLL